MYVQLTGLIDLSTTTGASIVTSGITSSGVTFALTTANDTPTLGGDNDTINGTYSDGNAASTFNIGGVLNGGAGTNTLIITSASVADISLADANWILNGGASANIQNITVTNTAAGAVNFATGVNFNNAFAAGGVNLTTSPVDGATTIDMQTVVFTGAATISVTSLLGAASGAETIKTGSGATTVTAIQHGSGAQVIDTTSTATAVTVNVTNDGAGGAQTVTTGGGNDTIHMLASVAGAASTINAGGGKDAITLMAADGVVQAITVTAGDSIQTAFDTITNFGISTGANSDTLALGSTALLTAAQFGGGAGAWTVTTGMATGGANLATFLTAATTSLNTGVVAYYDSVSGGTYVVASDGLVSGVADTVVELIGVATATAVGAAAATTIHIV